MYHKWSKLALQKAENFKSLMFDAERYLWKHPQTGFKEWEAHHYLMDKFTELGFHPTEAENIPGFYFDIDSGKEGPTVCILGELDSIINLDHPECREGTGAVHACGHHCQVSALLGVAGILADQEILSELCGKIRIAAVPAEELIELSERASMKEEGKIRYFSGKSEFMRRGYLDDVDIAIMIHTGGGEKPGLYLPAGMNGALAKKVTFRGKSVHAAYPEQGVNALYAAQTALTSINALRETFPDEYHVRTHPIITSGGKTVNNIPSEVMIETYVRASDYEVLKQINDRINRAYAAAALAFGAQITIEDLDVYMPEHDSRELSQIAYEVGCDLFGEENINFTPSNWSNGSSDMGNLSTVIPCIQPSSTGAIGNGHSFNYEIKYPEYAVLHPAAVQAAVACVLLESNAAKAHEVIAAYKPVFPSIAAYCETMDNICRTKHPITYTEEGSANLSWI